MTSERSVLLFVKSPSKGKVKSRLAAEIGEEAALAIYKNFVADLTGMLMSGGFPLKIFFHPPRSRKNVEKWLGKGFECLPQEGADLGEKMKNAFRKSFSEGIEKALLIGSDIPDLPRRILDEAFSSLEDRDAVIGPCADGGYYLIGFRRETFLPGIFDGIRWSSASVFGDTMRFFEKAGYAVRILSEWRDVDTLDDLLALFERNGKGDFRRSGTMKYLLENGKEIFSRRPRASNHEREVR